MEFTTLDLHPSFESSGDKLQQIWDHERPKAEPCRASPLFGRQKSQYLDATQVTLGILEAV